MLVRMIAGLLSLLAFSVATFAGVWAGNDLSTVLFRAWKAMILFLIFGALVGWMVQLVMDEYLSKNHQQFLGQLQQQFGTGNPQEKAPPSGTAMDSAAGTAHGGSDSLG
jgi:hypothetical protein